MTTRVVRNKLKDARACTPPELGTHGDSLALRCVHAQAGDVSYVGTCNSSRSTKSSNQEGSVVLHDALIYDTPSVEEYLESSSLKDCFYDTLGIEKCLESRNFFLKKEFVAFSKAKRLEF